MFSALKKLLSPAPYQAEAHKAYASLVAQARTPAFFTACKIPDTLDGRFDAIVLHMFLVLHRLQGVEPLFTRALQEAFFYDMDRGLREMGSTDTGVGKRVKQMVQAFYGRLQAYEQAIADEAAFEEALARNLHRGHAPDGDALRAAAAYVTRNLAHLNAQDAAEILRGEVRFSD